MISLAFAATIPAAWADDQTFSVAVQDDPPAELMRVLDLKAPDIHDVMSADEIAAALPEPDETEFDRPRNSASPRCGAAPYVPGGFAAIYWGLTHPMQSWRVLAPVQ